MGWQAKPFHAPLCSESRVPRGPDFRRVGLPELVSPRFMVSMRVLRIVAATHAGPWRVQVLKQGASAPGKVNPRHAGSWRTNAFFSRATTQMLLIRTDFAPLDWAARVRSCRAGRLPVLCLPTVRQSSTQRARVRMKTRHPDSRSSDARKVESLNL